MGKKFDLAAAIAAVAPPDVSKSDTPRVQMVPLDDIIPNELNFYELRDLAALADSIALDGLLDPLVITPHPEQPGKYQIISGHRRRAAIQQLVDSGEHPQLHMVPSIVREYASPAMAELQLILANSTARVLTASEISKQAERITLLLCELKEAGYEFPGRMRDQVAAACQVSAPKLARLKVIRERLIPQYLQLFDADRLPEQTAYALARMPADFQERIYHTLLSSVPTGGAAEQLLAHYNDGWRWTPELACPDGTRCKRGDTFLRHDAEHPYSMCGGNRCCLECRDAKESCLACDRMCSKAKAARKAVADKKKAAEHARAVERSDQCKTETQRNAQRLLAAIEAAGLPDDVSIPWSYYRGYDIGSIRAYANGQFVADSLWTSASLASRDLADPARTAQVLGCSTDYLLGLTDELAPTMVPAPKLEKVPAGEPEAALEGEDTPEWPAGWQTGPIPKAYVGWLVVRLCPDPEDPSVMLRVLLHQHHGGLHFRESAGSPNVDGTVIRWMIVPEEPDGEI